MKEADLRAITDEAYLEWFSERLVMKDAEGAYGDLERVRFLRLHLVGSVKALSKIPPPSGISSDGWARMRNRWLALLDEKGAWQKFGNDQIERIRAGLPEAITVAPFRRKKKP